MCISRWGLLVQILCIQKPSVKYLRLHISHKFEVGGRPTSSIEMEKRTRRWISEPKEVGQLIERDLVLRTENSEAWIYNGNADMDAERVEEVFQRFVSGSLANWKDVRFRTTGQ